MLNFLLNMALMNMIGGRFADIWGTPANGRLIFRCLLPGIVAGAYAGNWIVWAAVTAGSALWFPWGWGFDEISGQYSEGKYPRWLRTLGLKLFPLDGRPTTNRKRGILLKGVRGLFDVMTFALLSVVNPWAFAFWPLTFGMGFVYWSAGRLAPEGRAVLVAEAAYGAYRGLLIALAI